MQSKKKHVFRGFIVLALLLTMFSGIVSAEEDTKATADSDSELMKILNEHSDSPQLWMNYIKEQADNGMGQWLPELIKKLAMSHEVQSEMVDVQYKTVTKAYDWGPAINKIVLDFGQAIDPHSLNENTFDISSVRTYKEMDYTTFTQAETATPHKVKRKVIAVYTSDEEGNALDTGDYVTVEMQVGPTLTEGSPYNYNFLKGLNEIIETSYVIAQNPEGAIQNLEGIHLTFPVTGANEKSGDIKLIADDFDNNQTFSHEGIDLMYASFMPESASKEEGSNPLIIWLHGAGEGGTNTSIALMGNKVVNLATKDIQSYFGEQGAYILAPQSPTMWMDYDGTDIYNSEVEDSDGRSYYTEALMALIENYVSTHPEIDRRRIYIGGCSNGGYMTINMLINYPDYFAAAYPSCEAYSVKWLTEERIEAIKDIPIWLTHSLADGTVSIAKGETVNFTGYALDLDENGDPILLDDFSNALYNRLTEAGATNVHYSRFDNVVDTSGLYTNEDGTPYEYMGHWVWIYALNNECVDTIDGEEITLFDWLSQQAK